MVADLLRHGRITHVERKAGEPAAPVSAIFAAFVVVWLVYSGVRLL
jgi:hypothetical protein